MGEEDVTIERRAIRISPIKNVMFEPRLERGEEMSHGAVS